ncbi:hypothetical protein JMN32_22415 [Fulvivirga sp. 29W222]|uniref:DUF481 domain-containing protein n=1 Tax=Fulvivirga marina TaxID=2494733 RepID=A0A937G239_9BACT|nr:hypothetical protein [Fulvivirga marina]MBL6449083.1 hypothetical protein [Fulvivirga marina]
MKRLLLILLLFCSFIQLMGQGVSSQDSTNTVKEETDSTNHNRGQTLSDSLKTEWSEAMPDSTDAQKAKSLAKSALKDSLDNRLDIPDVAIDSTTARKAEGKAKQVLRDSLQQYVDVPDISIDSTTTDQVKSEAKSRAKAALEDELGEEIPQVTIDSTITRQVKDAAVKRAEEELKGTKEYDALNGMGNESELGQLEDYKNKLESTQEELRQAAAKQELKQKMASQAREYITQNADKIQQVQSQMGEMKKKYSYMPNSNDLSSAVKRTSLKDESFWERLVIGGNFNISKTNPLNIDLSPTLGYRVNKLFEVGVTGCYRSQFKADKHRVTSQSNEEVYGYSAYANHMVFKNFFAYLEAERMRTTTMSTEIPKREWKQTLLIGVGRRFNVAKWLEMQALVLFNVLHDNEDGLYNSPVVFKTGFRLRK